MALGECSAGGKRRLSDFSPGGATIRTERLGEGGKGEGGVRDVFYISDIDEVRRISLTTVSFGERCEMIRPEAVHKRAVLFPLCMRRYGLRDVSY